MNYNTAKNRLIINNIELRELKYNSEIEYVSSKITVTGPNGPYKHSGKNGSVKFILENNSKYIKILNHMSKNPTLLFNVKIIDNNDNEKINVDGSCLKNSDINDNIWYVKNIINSKE